MRIGILTQSINYNYGGILQNYALQTILQRMGYEVETLNWDSYRCNHENESFMLHFIQVVKTFISRFFLNRQRNYFWEQKNYFYQLSTNNQTFINEHIKISKWLWGKKQFRDYCTKKHFCALIVGSDQTWRPQYNKNGMLYRMFLDFASDMNIKRISYAASFGVDIWEFNDKQTRKCSELIQKFDAVSVREKSGIQLCKQHFNYHKTQWLLDPTLLLNPDDYKNLLRVNNKKKSNDTLLTTYILDDSTEKKHIIQYISQQKGLHITDFSPKYCNLGTVTKLTIKDYIPSSVTEWLKAFHDAEYIICDSFHGTVFSILFNKPFVAIGNKNRGYERFLSLLKLFELENNLIDETSPIEKALEVLNTPINWDRINDIREKLKQQSIQYLITNLPINY